MEKINNLKYADMSPRAVRALIREGKIDWNTSGMCAGYAQANLVILPKSEAYDFLLFAQRNPKSCPILEVGDAGNKGLNLIAGGVDITRDLPRYRVYEKGILTGEYTDVKRFWRDDLVSFLIGCSFSFESALLEANVPVRHIEEGKNVPMYMTNIDCIPAGKFSGKMVVSMRPLPPEQVVKSVTVTASMPRVHGSPIHIGDPSRIGVKDLSKPEFGDAVTINDGEVPVFWCCGVTPQSVMMNSKPDFVITHAPGHMFITDIRNNELMG
ncbi:MAG: putative hydro-lyase [Clostridiales bacterium]|jgi:uncharacterized protein YcsI (UPF0317 family)|nr:putative hydro-lyase [Clostridiales bacterium]